MKQKLNLNIFNGSFSTFDYILSSSCITMRYYIKSLNEYKNETDYSKNYEYKIENNEITITKYIGNEVNVIVPSEINDVPVTKIAERTFRLNNFKSITLPDSITEIEESAFSYCRNLKTITLPNFINRITGYTFYNCLCLESIIIPNSVTKIEEFSFYNCARLETITLSNSITKIEKWAFNNCSALKTITLPNSIIEIGNDTFNGCINLESITIPNSVIRISKDIFYNCPNLNFENLDSTTQEVLKRNGVVLK